MVSSVNLGCLVVGTAGLLLKGPETPKLKRKWRMDGYFKKGEHFFQVLYINHHYDIMTMYWIQWAEKTFKHSCLMNGWRWLALVDFEVWPFPDRHSRGQGRDNFNPQGLKPELPHDTYTQNGEDWEFLRKKRITFIHFLYSACWCGDYGCSLKSTLSMWTSWYIFMCNYIDVLMILSFVRRGIFGYQQSSHSATTSWRQLIWLQVVPESLLSALSEDSPTREAIGL